MSQCKRCGGPVPYDSRYMPGNDTQYCLECHKRLEEPGEMYAAKIQEARDRILRIRAAYTQEETEFIALRTEYLEFLRRHPTEPDYYEDRRMRGWQAK